MFWKNDTHGFGKSTATQTLKTSRSWNWLPRIRAGSEIAKSQNIPLNLNARKKSWDVMCIFCLVWSQVPQKMLRKILTSFNQHESLLILKLHSFSCDITWGNWFRKQKPPKSFQCPLLFRATLPHWARKMLRWRHFAKLRSPNGAKPCQNPPSASATKEVKGRQLVLPSIRKAKLLLLRSHLNCKPKFTNCKTRGERAGLVIGVREQHGTWYVPFLRWILAFPPGENHIRPKGLLRMYAMGETDLNL